MSRKKVIKTGQNVRILYPGVNIIVGQDKMSFAKVFLVPDLEYWSIMSGILVYYP